MNNCISAENLCKLIRQKDLDKYHISTFENACKIFSDINFSSFKFDFKKTDNIVTANNIQTLIILRFINHTLRSIYKVKQSDRHSLIKTINNLFFDKTEKWVIKTDIKEFYESINSSSILKKIKSDGILSYPIQELLKKALQGTTGLPRGLCISATLSELYMRDFDKAIKESNGVSYYARYVDDILVFSYKEQSDFDQQEKSTLVKKLYDQCKKIKLSINESKSGTSHIQLTQVPDSDPLKVSTEKRTVFVDFYFEYLGYSFSNKDKNVNIDISHKKVNKMKSRLVYAFLSYKRDHKYELLEKQIKFLTTNFIIRKDENRNLYSGIFYNYPLLNNNETLMELTAFYQKILFSNIISYVDLPKIKRLALRKYNFSIGHQKRIVSDLSIDDICTITQIWRSYEK